MEIELTFVRTPQIRESEAARTIHFQNSLYIAREMVKGRNEGENEATEGATKQAESSIEKNHWSV